MLFFGRRANLEFLSRFSPEHTPVDFKNVDGIIGGIIGAGKATLQELRTIYTLEDAFDILEVILVTRYNEYLAMQHAQKKGGK